MIKATTRRAGSHILNDANMANVPGWLSCKMESTKDILERDLSLAVQTAPKAFDERIRVIASLRSTGDPAKLNPEFERLAELEGSTLEFFKPTTKEADSLKDDSLAQLSFTNEHLKCLNHIPFILTFTAIFKIWLVPAINVIFPLIAWIIPYILLRFVYALPITHDQYMGIMQTMWSGEIMNPEAIFGPAPVQNILTPRSIAQAVFFIVSFSQSMIQPIQNAMHLHKTDGVFLKVGKDLLEIRAAIRRLSGLGVTLSNSLEELDDDPRRAFILVKEQPERLRTALRSLARLEIMWRISQTPQLQPVTFGEGPIALQDVVDISLKDGVPSSIELGDEVTHAVITGPNGGGKSSFMRAVLQAVLFGHSYGHAPAFTARMPRFKWIASGLQLRDTPGVLSMFETEVKFAATALSAGAGPGLVLFDELFHSTNAPDGTRTATLFLKQLWSRSNIYSVVSTHIFPLIEAAPKTVKAICCQATESPEGVKYSYRVEPGICRVSSVKMVWERFGLAAATAPTPTSF